MSMDFRVGTSAGHWTWKFAEDASGYLWIAFHYIGSEAVIGRYDPQQQQFELIDVGSELEDGEVVRHGMRDVRLDERGWLWVARQGVLVYDGQDWHSFSARLPSAHFADTRLTYEDREGNIWVGLWGGGLVCCDPFSTQLYSEADGLPGREVRCLEEDREGRLWIGTAGAWPAWRTTGSARWRRGRRSRRWFWIYRGPFGAVVPADRSARGRAKKPK